MNNPRILTVSALHIDDDAQVSGLVREIRANVDAFVFLSGGAARMSDERAGALLGLFEALAILADEGVRLGVADGGTEAGIMQAAGRARARSARAFPLIGVSPAPEIPPRGNTPVDPNHSVIVAVDNPDWRGTDGYFGSETVAMYRLFARLAEEKRSVAVVANGGGITLTEVDHNIQAGRPIILVSGSGRAADALLSMLGHHPRSVDEETTRLCIKAEALHLLRNPNLFHEFDMARGPAQFANTLRDFVVRPGSKT